MAALGLAVFVSCSPPRISSRYTPLHPLAGTDVTFSVEVSDREGVVSLELFLYERRSFVDNDDRWRAEPRPGGRWGLVQAWGYEPAARSAEESFTLDGGFPDASHVTFLFQATDRGGRVGRESWTFAAGASPFGDAPVILLGPGSNGEPGRRIDIAFVADRDDYDSGREMLPDLEALIFDGYHTNNVIATAKRYWAFWYSNELGHITDFDSGRRDFDLPRSVRRSRVIDHAAVIHTTEKRDWALGDKFGTEPENIGTAVHESAHSAFDLKDEYSGGGHGRSGEPHHNNYRSQDACRDYNSANGYPPGDCRNIEGRWWAPEPAALACIMLEDGDASMPDFARTCQRRAIWLYGRLEAAE